MSTPAKMPKPAINLRPATAPDIPAMLAFILEHGPNAWNYLPVADVSVHLNKIASGDVQSVLAEDAGKLLGFVTFHSSNHLARYQTPPANRPHGYVCEAVVHRAYAGHGIGSKLLRATVAELQAQGFEEIFIERHEENAGSAGMMRKAGFVIIDTFDDPTRRTHGSRRTTVCRFSAQQE